MNRIWTSVPRGLRLTLTGLAALLLVSTLLPVGTGRVYAQESEPDVGMALLGLAMLVGIVVGIPLLGALHDQKVAEELVDMGCPVPNPIPPGAVDACKRRQAYLAANPGTDPMTSYRILRGQYAIGMTTAEFRASVGPPDKINRHVGTFGVSEQWVYYHVDGINANYFYFDDGKLESWQTSRY